MKFIFFFLTLLIVQSASASLFDSPNDFKLIIKAGNFPESSYEDISFEKIENNNIINNYIHQILTPELKKYPDNYFKKIGLEQIVLCKNLIITEQKRAAIPDPYNNILFLSIDSFYKKDYLVHVLHHELHHITEFALWKDMFYDWKKWNRKNSKAFVYGTGGSSAYEKENQSIDWYEINNPKQGFVNLYSTLGQEEDRCEIVALIMTDSERKYLQKFIQDDKFLKRKVNLIVRILSKISKEKMNYWKVKLKS